MISNGRFVGGTRDRMVALATQSRAKMRNAQILIAQPNPTSGIKWMSMIGKMTPPSEDPETTRPIAAPRLAKNHVETWSD